VIPVAVAAARQRRDVCRLLPMAIPAPAPADGEMLLELVV